MGKQELIAAMEEQAERRIAQLYAEAEERRSAMRDDYAGRRELRLAEASREWRQAEAELRRRESAVGQRAARRMILEAEERLAARLRRLAAGQLPTLALTDGCWQLLFAELPEYDWEVVRVAARDMATAQLAFPCAATITVPETCGGIAATASGLAVDNTLEKRLERNWDDLLPGIMAEIRKELSNACATATD